VIVEVEESWEKDKEEKQKRTRRRARVNFVGGIFKKERIQNDYNDEKGKRIYSRESVWIWKESWGKEGLHVFGRFW